MDHKTWMEHFVTAVIVPAAWAIIAAAFVSIASFGITLAFKLITGEGDPRFWALILGSLTLVGVHLAAMDWWIKQVAPPSSPIVYESQDTRIDLVRNSGPYIRGDYDWISIPRSKLSAACRTLVERNFRTGALGGAGKVLSRSEAETLRDYMIKKELAYRVSDQDNAPWRINPEGELFIRKNASPPEDSLSDGWTKYGN